MIRITIQMKMNCFLLHSFLSLALFFPRKVSFWNGLEEEREENVGLPSISYSSNFQVTDTRNHRHLWSLEHSSLFLSFFSLFLSLEILEKRRISWERKRERGKRSFITTFHQSLSSDVSMTSQSSDHSLCLTEKERVSERERKRKILH